MASESAAWLTVQDIAAELRGSLTPTVKRAGDRLNRLAREMRAQLLEGVHENPALAIVGNPPRRQSWADRVYLIRYRHRADGQDYEHAFAAGVYLAANPDGTVTIYRTDGKPIWDEFPG